MSINVMNYRSTTGGGARVPVAVFETAEEFTEWASNCLPGQAEVTIVTVDETPIEVDTVEPEHNEEENTVTIPSMAERGLVYDPPGTTSVPEEGLTVTVSAEVGYVISEGSETSWSFDYVEGDGGE